jgi:hypothetical protein
MRSNVGLPVNVYRAACNVVEQVEGDNDLIETCREEAAQLESYIEPQS